MKGFEISLIVATYNWKEALSKVLDSVISQRLLPREVIVADDGSREDTASLIIKYQENFPVPLIHSWQPDKGFRLAESRNKAIVASSGDYLIMIDGDMVLNKKFILSHKLFAKKQCFVTGSRVMLSETLSEQMLAGSPFPKFYSKGVQRRLNTFNFPLLSNICTNFKGTKSCNMALWKNDIVSINGFNADFTGWGGEDSDLAVRLMNNGIKRRKFKFGGVAYHLYHEKSDRAFFSKNRHLLARSVDEKITWCENGLNKHFI